MRYEKNIDYIEFTVYKSVYQWSCCVLGGFWSRFGQHGLSGGERPGIEIHLVKRIIEYHS